MTWGQRERSETRPSYRRGMRFDLLFDDLEAQLEAEHAATAAGELVEHERLRAARTTLRDRIAVLAMAPAAIRVRLTDDAPIELVPTSVGRDWFAAELPGAGEAIVPIAAVRGIVIDEAQLGASRERMPEAAPRAGLSARLGVGVVLRDLARRRVALDVMSPGEAAPVHGTIDRVGSDHFDLAVHERGSTPRASGVHEHRIVSLAAVAFLRLG
ncbi:hypothetical protein ACFOYW_17895 [Gryllotalpicola reticulitermitis]|uniref:Cell wall-active antibiotics response LiaF-like C-terminal domain-containing protein n=1 Tax=Gryllotalpicola reticulitermitis TaxID=1184153 RepID=A0ABV8QA39_9MICO